MRLSANVESAAMTAYIGKVESRAGAGRTARVAKVRKQPSMGAAELTPKGTVKWQATGRGFAMMPLST